MTKMYKELEKKCKCGRKMMEIIGHTEREDEKHPAPYRKGWYCAECRHWEEAIFRERVVK